MRCVVVMYRVPATVPTFFSVVMKSDAEPQPTFLVGAGALLLMEL